MCPFDTFIVKRDWKWFFTSQWTLAQHRFQEDPANNLIQNRISFLSQCILAGVCSHKPIFGIIIAFPSAIELEAQIYFCGFYSFERAPALNALSIDPELVENVDFRSKFHWFFVLFPHSNGLVWNTILDCLLRQIKGLARRFDAAPLWLFIFIWLPLWFRTPFESCVLSQLSTLCRRKNRIVSTQRLKRHQQKPFSNRIVKWFILIMILVIRLIN